MITTADTAATYGHGASIPAALLASTWWMVATRGALALAFGGTISLWSNPTLPFIVMLFAVYAVLDGAWAIGTAVLVFGRSRRVEPWPVALEGLVSVAVGAAALWWPLVPDAFVQLVAMLGVITGGLELLTAAALPRDRAMHWVMATAGAWSISLTVLILLIPRADAALIVYLIASYGIVFGVFTMNAAASFRDAMKQKSQPSRRAAWRAEEVQQ